MNESELVNGLIKRQYDDWDEVEVESHYNYYGDRGVADLYAADDKGQIHIYEIKSEAALDEVTGANEIIRQFNQMQEYYFRDESNTRPTGTAIFFLAFYPTERTVAHLRENFEMYESACGHDRNRVAGGYKVTIGDLWLIDSESRADATKDVLEDERLLKHLGSEHPVKKYHEELGEL
jgi:hypothetical protein